MEHWSTSKSLLLFGWRESSILQTDTFFHVFPLLINSLESELDNVSSFDEEDYEEEQEGDKEPLMADDVPTILVKSGGVGVVRSGKEDIIPPLPEEVSLLSSSASPSTFIGGGKELLSGRKSSSLSSSTLLSPPPNHLLGNHGKVRQSRGEYFFSY